MSESAIEWTDRTWNPIVGCSILSPGCTNCYAMGEAARQIRCAAGLGRETHYAGTVKNVKGKAVWTGKLALAPESILLQPLKRKKPTMYFVNSMGDLFHEDCPDEWIDKVFAVMALCPQHTFQVLTKRAKRMRRYLTNAEHNEVARAGIRSPGFTVVQRIQANVADYIKQGKFQIGGFGPVYQEDWQRAKPYLRPLPLPNVWLGVSTERQQEADERIPELLQTPAAVKFISAEPLLGPIDLTRLAFAKTCDCRDHSPTLNALDATVLCEGCCEGPERLDIGKLSWVIVGGESGPGCRPMHPDWARSLRDQCAAAGVAYFFKQWGSFVPIIDRDNDDPDWRRDYTRASHDPDRFKILNLAGGCGFHGDRVHLMQRYSKTHAGRLLDGIEHNDMPGRSA